MTDVSVIIAAYNVAPYIERAIRSALDQKDVSVEVIVINDGSTDGTAQIIGRIQDDRIITINLPGNSGPAAARNAGLKAASGTWVAILDGDDAFEPGRLAHCLQKAEALRADIIVDNLVVCDETGKALNLMFSERLFKRLPQIELADFIQGNQSFLGGGLALGYMKPVITNAFLQRHNIQYDPEIRIGEDYMLMAECLAKGALCVTIPEAGYRYTKRMGSTSHRITLEDIQRIQDGDKKFLTRCPLNPAAQRAQRQRTIKLDEAYYFTLLVNAIKQRRIADIFTAILHEPTAPFLLWRPLFARVKGIF